MKKSKKVVKRTKKAPIIESIQITIFEGKSDEQVYQTFEVDLRTGLCPVVHHDEEDDQLPSL